MTTQAERILQQAPKLSHEVERMLGVLTQIAGRAKQLNIGALVSAAARKCHNVVDVVPRFDRNPTCGTFPSLRTINLGHILRGYTRSDSSSAALLLESVYKLNPIKLHVRLAILANVGDTLRFLPLLGGKPAGGRFTSFALLVPLRSRIPSTRVSVITRFGACANNRPQAHNALTEIRVAPAGPLYPKLADWFALFTGRAPLCLRDGVVIGHAAILPECAA